MTVAEFVPAMFQTFIHRLPPEDQVKQWVDLLTKDGTRNGRSQFLLFLIQSEEGRAQYVDGLYQTILGRASDPAGKEAAVAWIRKGGTGEKTFQGSIELLILSMYASDEFFAKSAPGGGVPVLPVLPVLPTGV